MGDFLLSGVAMRALSLVVLMLGLVFSPHSAWGKAEIYAGFGSPASDNPIRPHYNKDNGEKNYGGSVGGVWFDRPKVVLYGMANCILPITATIASEG